ncbi:MAG: general stress protein CsbD [Bacteroidales bacterium]|nr:general stress protein CsbD [Bacteroidales bacterium]
MVNWDEHKDKLIQKYPKLTEKDLDFKEGKMNEMLGRLQIKLGKTRKELHKLFATL